MNVKHTTINEIITYLNSGHCPYAIIEDALLINTDSIKLLRQFPANSIDACVSDGPYGIGIMGKEWDNFKPKALSNQGQDYQQGKDHKLQSGRSPSMHAGQYDISRKGAIRFQEWCYMGATELYRVLKPGAYILMFCSPRMYHRLVCGIEDAGFQVKDTLMWLYGEAFPKSKNISKFIRDTERAKQWEGFGMGIKPAYEPILLAQKPREGTYANNVLKYGVGGLNIDACRIGDKGGTQAVVLSKQNKNRRLLGGGISNEVQVKPISKGRFPSNIIIDDYVAEQLKEKSRYFYSPKISEKEKHAGCEHLHFKDSTTKGGSRTYEDYCGNCGKKFISSENTRCHCPKGDKVTMRPEKSGNIHPTVKPASLMQYLIEMIVPPQAICLDIFAGSGSTGIACNTLGMGRQFIGIDIEKDYFEIAKARLSYWSKQKKSA
jgi:site-specific DNA-methyltransferase (adenine-specific)